MKMKNLKNVSAGTWIRLVLLTLALVNSALGVFGINPLTENSTAAQVISTLASVLTALAAYWKNNSFTYEAVVADRLMKGLKEGKAESDNTAAKQS